MSISVTKLKEILDRLPKLPSNTNQVIKVPITESFEFNFSSDMPAHGRIHEATFYKSDDGREWILKDLS